MNEKTPLQTAIELTLRGSANADERQQVREYISQLEAQISAIPMDDIQRMQGCEAHTDGTELAKVNVRIWLEANGRFGIWPDIKNPDGWYDPTGTRFLR